MQYVVGGGRGGEKGARASERATNTVNWALRRPAIQSSRSNETAGRAVDGIKSGHRDHHTETSEEDNPWWRVTLEREIEVQEVVITKGGGCCDEHMIDVIRANGIATACVTTGVVSLGDTVS
ncbi:hypothetical protein LSAT2_009936 [Lamellibrachia satsuma]|nr:hypothetical protein LSAT2_009936 [Lamellibrachia satsuma]